MRSMRLVGTMLALVLIASACGGDDENEEEGEPPETTPTQPATTQTTAPGNVTTPTAPLDTVLEVDVPDPSDTEVMTEDDPEEFVVDDSEVGPPLPPTSVSCVGGTDAGELFVEWNALPNPSEISKIRVYVSEDGGAFITNGEFTMGQVDTNREGGNRWAAPARRLPVNVPLRLTATSFNLIGQESGWYITNGLYTGPGQPCGTDAPVIPPTVCTAGCDEEEGEPAA